MQWTPSGPLLPRQTGSTGSSTGSEFLQLVASTQLAGAAVLSSLLVSIILAGAIALLFCFLRPYNSNVYAPRAKHADTKHAPPPVNSGLFGWIPPLRHTKEQDVVEKAGVDAAVFMRVCKMLRNIFIILSVIGCGILIPVNLVAYSKNGSSYSKRQTTTDSGSGISGVFQHLTPLYIYGGSGLWAYVVVAYLFDGVVLFFLWTNYKAILRLRRSYFMSPDYQNALHSRTLLVSDIPPELRSDEGIVKIAEEVKATPDIPRAAIARNVKDLPELVEEHEKTVKELEEHLAKYLKNPDRLPAKRPVCTVSKNDQGYTKGQQVDAIEYLTHRIRDLELEIKQVRESVDKRNALSYGFASFANISEAHEVARAATKGASHGTTIRLAPKPQDLVWKNLKLSKSERKRRNILNMMWVSLLTVVWIAPNVLMAVFLSNLTNLGKLWHTFQTSLETHPTWWAIVQGVAAPAITTLFYFFLPAIFRKLCMNAGDFSKTSRERHVMRALYAFFTFNNLIVFSLFSAVFNWGLTIAKANNDHENGLEAFEKSQPLSSLVSALYAVSPYWVSWLLQRNLGAAIDLSQLFTLAWSSLSRRFSSPTPRELIQLSAPQPFDYAAYYNYFLFYSTVAMGFAALQPLVLPVTAFYFTIDSFFKKYLILYVFITKNESGGMFWRSIYNRVLFLTLLGNLTVALVILSETENHYFWMKLAAMIPLPCVVAAFKWYCVKTFDGQLHWYQDGQTMQEAGMMGGKRSHQRDRVGVRFGNPVLYKPLITPMVSARSRHLLESIYAGRLSSEGDPTGVAGYSDVYMESMDTRDIGKSAGAHAPYELVDENQMNFEYFKSRPEFRDEAGGDGALYGRAPDDTHSRPTSSGTSIMDFGLRAGAGSAQGGYHSRDDSGSSAPGARSRSGSRGSERRRSGVNVYAGGEGGVEYPRGYHQTPSALRDHSPVATDYNRRKPVGAGRRQDSREHLVSTAARMGQSPPPFIPPPNVGGYDAIRIGSGPGRGMGAETPGSELGEEDTSYDYFRRGRVR